MYHAEQLPEEIGVSIGTVYLSTVLNGQPLPDLDDRQQLDDLCDIIERHTGLERRQIEAHRPYTRSCRWTGRVLHEVFTPKLALLTREC